VVSPLLCLMLGDGEHLIFEVVPPALLEFSRSVLRSSFASVIQKNVYTFAFDRSSIMTEVRPPDNILTCGRFWKDHDNDDDDDDDDEIWGSVLRSSFASVIQKNVYTFAFDRSSIMTEVRYDNPHTRGPRMWRGS
jgi:hypothetical protein